MIRVSFAFFLALAVGCSEALTPQEVKAVPITDLFAVPAEYHVALKAAAEYLKAKGEEPSEFYVSDISRTKETVVLPLWHKSAFQQKERVVGNPGGKSRNLEYNTAQNKVTGELFWQ